MQESHVEPDVPFALVCVLLAAHLASSSSRPSYQYDIEVAVSKGKYQILELELQN